MKLLGRLLGMVLLVCVWPAVHAADMSGMWKGDFDFQGSTVSLTLTLKAGDGGAVTGTMEGLPTSPVDIHDGKIDGDSITFWLNSDYQGQTYKLVYRGKMAADAINFDFGTEDGSWGTSVTMKRAGTEGGMAPAGAPAAMADVTGSWMGSFDLNGTQVPVTFKLKSDGPAVTGTIEGMGPAPVEIHDGKVDGQMVTFSVNVDYQGQTYALQYKGKIAAGEIDFDFGTADGAWGASVNAKKG